MRRPRKPQPPAPRRKSQSRERHIYPSNNETRKRLLSWTEKKKKKALRHRTNQQKNLIADLTSREKTSKAVAVPVRRGIRRPPPNTKNIPTPRDSQCTGAEGFPFRFWSHDDLKTLRRPQDKYHKKYNKPCLSPIGSSHSKKTDEASVKAVYTRGRETPSRSWKGIEERDRISYRGAANKRRSHRDAELDKSQKLCRRSSGSSTRSAYLELAPCLPRKPPAHTPQQHEAIQKTRATRAAFENPQNPTPEHAPYSIGHLISHLPSFARRFTLPPRVFIQISSSNMSPSSEESRSSASVSP